MNTEMHLLHIIITLFHYKMLQYMFTVETIWAVFQNFGSGIYYFYVRIDSAFMEKANYLIFITFQVVAI